MRSFIRMNKSIPVDHLACVDGYINLTNEAFDQTWQLLKVV